MRDKPEKPKGPPDDWVPGDLNIPKLDRKFWLGFIAALFDLFFSLVALAASLAVWAVAMIVIGAACGAAYALITFGWSIFS